MGCILEFRKPGQATHHLESLRTLALLLLQEIETLGDISTGNAPKEEREVRLQEEVVPDEPRTGSIDLSDQVQQFEISLICEALVDSQGNQTRAAKKLRMKKSTLHAKIQRHKIRFEPNRLGGRAFAE